MSKILLQGNEACVEGALQAGVSFFAGYPITPSTEIAEKMAEKLPQTKGVFIQMEDEIASMAAIIGASIGGAKSMTATSGPGFSLMQENIGFAAMTEIPVVVVNVMRGGPSTGTPTMPSQGDFMQARWGTHGDHPIIALAPSSVQEAYDLTITAVNMAERYMTPVLIMMDEVVAHMREGIELRTPKEVITRQRPTATPETYRPYQVGADNIPRLAPYGTGYRYHITGLYHDETGFPTNNNELIKSSLERMHAKLTDNLDDIIHISCEDTNDADVIFLAYGSPVRSARFVKNKLQAQGKKVGLIQLTTLWPFPHDKLREIAGETNARFVVPELSLGQLAGELEKSVDRERIIPVQRVDGALITPQELEAALKGVL
ncbi:MAG: 2-oxoacid:acceptor oxidoreductase subunit alpha [Firmicutes bacterium]|nr:2-oxoacid:acceptor oxidoreductase subunit alpha [Bacillota bacterium]